MSKTPIRVLIVEDSPTDAKLLEHELRRGGLDFTSARVDTEPDFISALSAEPDIVLCDWQMPEFDSIRALALLQEQCPDTPLVLVSGSIGEEAAVKMIKLGASDYVLKDRRGRLVLAVQQALSTRDLQKSAQLTQAALRRSERQLAEAQRVAGLGSWVWEPVSGTVSWSDAMFTVLGLDRAIAQPSYETFLSVLHPDDRPTADSRVAALMDGADEFANDLRIVRPNGTCVWIHSRARATRDEMGQVVRVEGTDQDITERKQLEEQFRQAQKMEAVGRLAGGVAHDFNNLLTVINCHSEIALSETGPGHPLRESMAAIRDAGERAANLTQQLLTFSRRAIVALRVLDLNDVVASITRMLRRLIGEDIAFATVHCPTPCRVRIDPGQIEQVIMNLAVNARDAMPKGGRLTIETNHEEVLRATPDCPAGRYVRLAVTDTGTGMTDDVKARIFEPFFTTKEVGMGTGLGLATVYGIVKQAGGHIGVESTIAKGTTFEVMFPEAESSVKDKLSDSIRFAPRGSETILLAEDEDAVRKVARLGLEMQGYIVIETGTGSEAIATAASYPGPIQLLVTDVIMPELGGRELADAIRANRPDIRVLYVSGYTSDALVRHGVEQGVDSFLQKPFTPLTLARKVRMVLDAPAPGVIP
jgi:two-component system, cell cycle sensor histidine kinase and response regulator CckA